MAKKGFTEKAREAARLKRAERNQELRQNFGIPEVFVVRNDDGAFSYEIRRFGALVLSRGVEHFDTSACARTAGEACLRASSGPHHLDQPVLASI